VIALRREETGVLVMELSEHLWPDNLELTIPALRLWQRLGIETIRRTWLEPPTRG
jgi:hypothetical protein